MDLLRHLRYFAVVAEEGHIGRAAERLDLAQPALSQRVKALEAALGVPLVVKDGRGIRVTEQGRLLGERAAALVDSADHIAADLQPANTSGVEILVPPTFAPERLAVLARTLADCYAPRGVRTVPLPPPERERRFAAGSVDAVLLVTPAEGDVSLPLGAALAADHPLASMATVHPSDLNEERVLVLDEDEPRRAQLAAQLDRHGLDAEWIEWGQAPVSALARAWAGAVCLTDPRHAADAGLVWVPLAGTPLRRELELRWAPGRHPHDLGAVMRAVAAALEAEVAPQPAARTPVATGTLARILDLWAGVEIEGAVHVRDLDSAAELGIDSDESWPLASVAKVPLAVALHRAAERGLVDLDQPRVLRPDGRTRGTTGISAMSDSVTMSLRDAAYLALTISDNAAADAIWDAIGADRIRASLREVVEPGEVWLGEPTRDLYDRVEFGDGAVDGPRACRATPRGATRLLARIWADEAASAPGCAHLRDLMQRQVWTHRLASGFPAEDIVVAGKTGTVQDHRHEIGVVTYPDGSRYAVAVFSRRRDRAAHHRWDWAIGETARLAVNAMRRGETSD
ncbi:serine hydrolase [Enemella dayhoffiae]|uniref:serine hydrolase n=1 Tax=Enemella dayhoffiae TaxID=2016507 RepID=UPI001595BA51|nr:serine hydrolase [Enemella dayhoffiae]